MSYTPYLISNYSTGYDREVQPWLLPEDAWVDLLDGFVYRGVTQKRDGYLGFATGLNSVRTESRMVHNITYSYTVTGDIDGVNDAYTIQLTTPVTIGSVHVFGSNPVQQLDDDGAGAFTGDGTGTINYVTGAVTVTFTAPPALGSTVTVTYGNYGVGDGTVGPYTNTLANTPIARGSITITAGAQVVTDDGVGGFTGDGTGTIDYTTGGVSVTFDNVVASGDPITITYNYYPGLPVMGIMNFYTSTNTRQLLVADTTYVNKYDPGTDTFVDISPATPYTGQPNKDFWSWVNYPDASNAPRLLFTNLQDPIQMWNGSVVTDYPSLNNGSPFPFGARMIFEIKDRLVAFQTKESGVIYPRRIRISGFGSNTDEFGTDAPGAGIIEIPDNTWFYGAAFNRDDILFFTEAATWMLKYTGNDVTPFSLEKIDGSRGSKAAFSVVSYLNRTMAASPRGLIISDGYKVDRMDNNIPFFTINDINNGFFESCFSGFLDEDRDVYTLYPSVGDIRPEQLAAGDSDRILVSNFEEDNFAIYTIPMSCVGNFQGQVGLIWANLTAANGFPNWDAMAERFSTWNAFPYNAGFPVTIGGGHKGEVWTLNADESEDNPQPIRSISIIDGQTIEVTTDWNNYAVGDYIFFDGVEGMVEINKKQGELTVRSDYNTFRVNFGMPMFFSAYTTGGTAVAVIPFNALTKKLNPFLEGDKKIRIGWLYFYVDVTETRLTKLDENEEEVPVPALIDIDIITNDSTMIVKPTFTIQVDCSLLPNENGTKKWVKIWINQVARFLQFRIRNNQAGAKIKVHAMMPGMQGIGRLI